MDQRTQSHIVNEPPVLRDSGSFTKDFITGRTEPSKLLAIFGQAPVGIALLEGPDHIFTLANPKYLSTFFGGRQDFIGKPAREAVPEAVEQGFIGLLDRVYQTGEPFIGTETPIELVQPDGKCQKFFLNFIYQPLRDNNQAIHGILAVIQDVTEQVVNRAKAEESEQKIRTLIEALPQLVWTCTSDGECDYLSPQWVEYTGVPASAQFKMQWVETVLHPDDRKRVWDHWLGALREEHGYDIEYRIRRHDGAYRWFKTRAIPVRDEGGAIVSWFGTCTDINDTKEVEAKLSLERALLETIFQKSPAAMVLWKGPNLVFDKINPGYQAIFSDRELLGKPFAEALPETKGQPFEKWIKDIFETGETKVQPEQLAKLVLYSGGPIEDRYFDMSFVRVMGADNEPYGVYEHAVDVTERVLSRRAVEKSKAELETTVKSLEQERDLREQFVSTLTHDLRNPLTAAKMSAQLISRSFESPEKLTSLSGRIIDSLNRANQMIENLLDANRIKAGEPLKLEMHETGLVSLVKTTLSELATTLGDRFVVDSQEAVISGVWSADAIRRILENLCSNAVKYGLDRTPITIRLRQDSRHILILVHNFGNPIPSEELARLFEPYRRASTSNEVGSVQGWGLGLTLVKGLAEAHGGSVSVSSNVHEGTIFTVKLPKDASG